MNKEIISVFWFRRDLRLEDNLGLSEALKGKYPVLPVFIFDSRITDELDENDARITFIFDQLSDLSLKLKSYSGSVFCAKGIPINIWKNLLDKFNIQAVYANEDYEPYAIQRDKTIEQLLADNGVKFNLYKDQVIFAKEEILKSDNTPYTVFTPYKNKWLEKFYRKPVQENSSFNYLNFYKTNLSFPGLSELGFKRSSIEVLNYDLDKLENYEEVRNFPALNQTSHLSPHLRFGTVSIRRVVQETSGNQAFLSELIWREFFMQILYHFPNVVVSNFNKKYDNIQWRNNPEDFEK